jgi:hypothetical protein
MMLLWKTLTSPFVPFPQEAIAKDVQTDCEEGDGKEVHVRVPCRELDRIVRSGYDGGGDELGFVCEFRQSAIHSEEFPWYCDLNSPPKTASVVTSVNQPAILIHPTRKLWIG